ncbi:cell division protein ZapD [Psychromonas sp. MB-3u-54]|uniref:cell division protein ZapD n=1 Tax=Psychromonas sp. MB-3u-54 TaxID=2058319 RepID=UPI000C34C2D2|nr:cell division protein ZapD [Psychromonas sp. MB-3u-54]PKH03584.1 cell division protein ZapD [Psychromonas sp. MB-3u-54]
MIVFEYPLNEKNRSYLRFESLFTQLKMSLSFEHVNDSTIFFKALLELVELAERSDIRHDLVKDLRLLSEQMRKWLNHAAVDQKAVTDLISEIEGLIQAVLRLSKQLRFFKDNRLLTSLKQRFFIPGGTCNFDLPQFHFWLAGDLEKRQNDAQSWFSHFASLEKALTLFLKIKRSQAVDTKQIAKNGFYQAEVEKCGFIVVKVDQKQGVYPVISGHNQRYSIRFMNAESEKNTLDSIDFQQMCC